MTTTPVQCPACGHPLLVGANFCNKCGKPLDAPAEPVPTTPSGIPAAGAPPASAPKSGGLSTKEVIIYLVVAVIGIFFFAVYKNGGCGKAPNTPPPPIAMKAVPDFNKMTTSEIAKELELPSEEMLKAAEAGNVNVTSLIEALKNQDSSVRQNAALVLGAMGEKGRDAAGVLGQLVMNDKEVEVAVVAAHALGKMSPDVRKEVGAKIIEMAIKSTDIDLRDRGLVALEKIDPKGELFSEYLMKQYAAGGTVQKRNAVYLMAAYHGRAKNVLPVLLKAIKSKDRDMVNAGLWGLQNFGPEAREAEPMLIRLVKDTEFRFSAAQALSKIGTSNAAKKALYQCDPQTYRRYEDVR